MRSLLVLVVLVATATAAPAPIHVAYDTAHLDLDKHTLQFKPSRAITEASLVAIGEDGTELGKGDATYKDEALAMFRATASSDKATAFDQTAEHGVALVSHPGRMRNLVERFLASR